MKISIITDEITQSFEEAVCFAKSQNLCALEFRTVDDIPIHEIDDLTLNKWKNELDKNNLKTSCLASSFYKCEPIEHLIADELIKLERLCMQAEILDTEFIRGFTFFAEQENKLDAKTLAQYFKKPIEILKKYDKILLLEADPSVNTPTHKSLAECLKAIDSEHIAAIFDPGNSIYANPIECPFPDAYYYINPYIKHIHIKDSVSAVPECYCVKVGTGQVDYPKFLSAVSADGYNGYFSMETHYRHDVNLSESQMKQPGGSEFSAGGMSAASESIEALREIYKEVTR